MSRFTNILHAAITSVIVCYLHTLVAVGNLLSSLMSSYDDDISDDGTSDEHRVAGPSTVELD